MELPKPHLLNNPGYVRPLLEKALELISQSACQTIQPYSLARQIADELALPQSEISMITCAIAPKFAPKVTIEYLHKALDRLDVAKPIATPVVQTALTNISTKESRLSSLASVKREMVELLKQYKVITGEFLVKRIGLSLQESGVSLKALEVNCTLQEASWSHNDFTIIAAPGFESSKESLVQQILSEAGHKPFNVNMLAERIGVSTEDAIKMLKGKRIGSLLLWSPYDVWSVGDISISQERLDEIRKYVSSRGERPILLDDAFDWVVRGVVARNLYPEIFVESKSLAVFKAFGFANIDNYHFDKTMKSFVSSKKKTIEKPTPLYKPLWEDE